MSALGPCAAAAVVHGCGCVRSVGAAVFVRIVRDTACVFGTFKVGADGFGKLVCEIKARPRPALGPVGRSVAKFTHKEQ